MCFKTDNIFQLYTGITLLSFSGTNLYYFKSLKYIKTTGPWRGFCSNFEACILLQDCYIIALKPLCNGMMHKWKSACHVCDRGMAEA